MGILRFMLAFAVFNGHANLPLGFSVVAGSTAVHCFFVISGFYMAMVLNEKYVPSGASYLDFISSRLFRLAPAYLTVVVLTILAA
ncbi:MAG TPA: acyltransferase family protein, partial [Burkholderiales bacterium]|nr:acyltransferase family protein [Burkholderiales bacterium]